MLLCIVWTLVLYISEIPVDGGGSPRVGSILYADRRELLCLREVEECAFDFHFAAGRQPLLFGFDCWRRLTCLISKRSNLLNFGIRQLNPALLRK